MPLEDIVPTRAQISAWLKEINDEEEVKRGPARLPEQAVIRANHKSKVRKLLDDHFEIPEEAKEKILSDLSSYSQDSAPERITRQF